MIVVDPATAQLPGLSVREDEVALRPAAFGSPLPVDPGRHLVRAEAPGHAAWQAAIEIGTEPGRKTITVPALAPLPSKPARSATPPKPGVTQTPGALELTPVRLGAIALGGAGIASLGIGAAALGRALDEKASSDKGCGAGGCTPAGENHRSVAHEAATWATVGAVSGVALLGAGAVLWVLGKPSSSVRVGSVTILAGPGEVAVAGSL